MRNIADHIYMDAKNVEHVNFHVKHIAEAYVSAKHMSDTWRLNAKGKIMNKDRKVYKIISK
jgi:Holliday junction resolvase